MYKIDHHGAVDGVTGSCHELWLDDENHLLVDCGLFQGSETSKKGSDTTKQAIEFDVSRIRALLVTHVHLDHVGRIPYLLAAGFKGPIYCSIPSAKLLPFVLEDALRVGVTQDARLIEAYLEHLKAQIVPLEYYSWQSISLSLDSHKQCQIKLSPAGHILGSAYITIRIEEPNAKPHSRWDVIFSGDLGAPYAPLLAAPLSPYQADQLVLESTYGDRQHEDRLHRKSHLRSAIEHALEDGGVVLIPAFSLGRTQELLYEIESLIHQSPDSEVSHTASGAALAWQDLDIIIDSPLASRFTDLYKNLSPYWDNEAKLKIERGRHPLSFDQLTTIHDHEEHLQTVAYLAKQKRPAIVIAASGMCSGGRIVNYLKALISDPRNDVLFVGFQAQGTPGRDILRYHNHPGGYVVLDGERYSINAKVTQISGYSAHADQQNLVQFVKRMRYSPKVIHLVHGERDAKLALKSALLKHLPQTEILD